MALNALGGGLALYVFMADALRTVGQGLQALERLLPVWFNWPLFALAWVLLSVPVAELTWRARRSPGAAQTGAAS